MNIKSFEINRSSVKQALMSLEWICKHVSQFHFYIILLLFVKGTFTIIIAHP